MAEERDPVLFVSHHSSKLGTAEHVERALNAKGVQCWIAPRDIEPGEQWDVAIRQAIAQTDAMLLLFCSSSEKSKQVKRELILADQLGKSIIPLRLERIDPGQLSYHLADSQWIDWLEQRDEVIERIAAKAHDFMESGPCHPSPPVVIPGGSDGDERSRVAEPVEPTAPPAPVSGADPAFQAAAPFGGAPMPQAAAAPHGSDLGYPAGGPPGSDAPARGGGSRKWLWIGLAALLLAAIGGLLAYFLWPDGRQAEADEDGITEGWFIGSWSDSRDCQAAYRFERGGTVVVPGGERGTWYIKGGDTLVVEGSGGREESRIERVSEDEVRGDDGPAYRCN